jgi:Centromere DNA-binding protein complex CBF3 subunit, domain 2
MELWTHQVSAKLHSSPSPHNVAVKALKTSIMQGQHARRRAEFDDRGLSTIRDGYTAKQIPDMTRAVWRDALGPQTSEQSLRTNLDFLFGHAMLLRQRNRLPLELPDLFSLDLPKEGQKGKGWCFVVVMDQGKHHPSLSLLRLKDACILMLTTSYFYR